MSKLFRIKCSLFLASLIVMAHGRIQFYAKDYLKWQKEKQRTEQSLGKIQSPDKENESLLNRKAKSKGLKVMSACIQESSIAFHAFTSPVRTFSIKQIFDRRSKDPSFKRGPPIA